MKGKIGENERTMMWEMDSGGLCVLTSLGGQGLNYSILKENRTEQS